VLAGGTAFGAVSSIPDGSGVIHGCYDSGGNLKVIDTSATTTCPKNFSALDWNQTGPQGPTGLTGATGATGPQGPTGPAGTGATVSSLASGNSNCPSGGAQIADGNGNVAYACNGVPKYAAASGTANGGQAFLFDNSGHFPLDGYWVLGDCDDINTPDMTMSLGSYAFKPAQVWMDVAGSTPTYKTFQYGAGGDFAIGPAAPTDGGVQQITWHVLDSSGPVTITAWDSSSGGTCTFTAEATGH
jgi:hypothetical protein